MAGRVRGQAEGGLSAMDPISLIIGGTLLAVGWLAGQAYRRRNRTPELPSTATMCSCGHGHGTHAEGGACKAEIKRPATWNYYAQVTGYEWVPCPCRSYDGPEPLPRVWTG